MTKRKFDLELYIPQFPIVVMFSLMYQHNYTSMQILANAQMNSTHIMAANTDEQL